MIPNFENIQYVKTYFTKCAIINARNVHEQIVHLTVMLYFSKSFCISTYSYFYDSLSSF